MKVDILGLLMGERVIPEGFTTAIGKRFILSQPGQVWQFQTDPHFYFNLQYIRATWGISAAETPIFDPKISIYRDRGVRAYQGDEPIPLIEVSSPGAFEISAGSSAFATFVKVNKSTQYNSWFDPNSVIKANISGYRIVVGDQDQQVLDLTYFGRYYNRSQAKDQ